MNRIIDLMRIFNLNERQLAEDIDIHPTTVSNLVCDKIHLKDEVILKICKKYKVSADWLLGISNTPKDLIGEKCNYNKRKHDWVSGCGWRVNYNKHWVYCPHCGRHIMNLARLQKGD